MSDADDNWVCVGHVRDGAELAARFVIDARWLGDDHARAIAVAAGDELDRRRLGSEFEYLDVRPDEPVPDLPTWDEYRATLPDEAAE